MIPTSNSHLSKTSISKLFKDGAQEQRRMDGWMDGGMREGEDWQAAGERLTGREIIFLIQTYFRI